MRISTALKRVTASAMAVVLAFSYFAAPSSKPAEVNAAFRSEYEPKCETAYMLSMDTGKVIFEKDGDKKMLPASLTKMMTCIIAYERADSLDEMVVVDSRAVRFVNYNKEGATGVWTNIKVNERFTLKDLIYYALVASENCAAEAIGYYISKQYYGSDTNDEFIQFMNDRATEIGCTNTHRAAGFLFFLKGAVQIFFEQCLRVFGFAIDTEKLNLYNCNGSRKGFSYYLRYQLHHDDN